jgi:phage terminase large subunit-like protein
LACQRQINDLKRSQGRGFAYRFDEGRGNRVCRFLEALPHTKGKWAATRQNIRLEPWQCFVETSIFGWVRIHDGKRRFREAYVCVPRKNGKSIIAGGNGNYMFAADGEFGAEVYSGATSEKQAWEVFRPAQQMVERTAALQEAFGIEVRAKSMVVLDNGSRFEPVIGKPGDGASPSCAIVDEYHEHETDDLYDTMRTGMGAREQPLMLVITTSGSNTAGPCMALQRDVEKMLEGVIERDELFGIIYTIDAKDDWTTEEALRKANPNYDVSVFGDYLKTEQQNAIRDSRKQNIFKTKHLNIWCNAKSAWMNMEGWKAAEDTSLRPEQFKGTPCFIGIDLGSKSDLTAVVKIFRKGSGRDTHYYVFPRIYVPSLQVEKPDRQDYQSWAKNGHIVKTDGCKSDLETILEDIAADVHTYRAECVAYDPWGMDKFIEDLKRKIPRSCTVIDVPQRVQYLSEPMKEVDALVLDSRLHHDGNPAMSWCISNVIAIPDKNDNLFPDKETYDDKIDGATGLFTGMVPALAHYGTPKSIYSTRGVLTA